MFSLDQIHAAHSKVKSGSDFPHYVQDLIQLGVRKYDIYVHDGHAEYFWDGDYEVISPAKYETLTIADVSDGINFQERLKAHQRWETDYMTFCTDSARSSIEKWTVDTKAMTCTYYDKSGGVVLEEKISLS